MRNRENKKRFQKILLLIYVVQKTIYHKMLEYTNNIKNVLYCIVLTTKIMQTECKEAKTIGIR